MIIVKYLISRIAQKEQLTLNLMTSTASRRYDLLLESCCLETGGLLQRLADFSAAVGKATRNLIGRQCPVPESCDNIH